MDCHAVFMRKLYWWHVLFIEKFSTLIAIIKFHLWGISYGKGIRVIGKIILFRDPKSIVRIGNYCIFNSSSRLNFRGINHPCILQTGYSGAKIIIGNHVEMSGVSIVSNNSVTIGNHVIIGANSQIGDRDGHYGRYRTTPQSIEIKDHVWVGMNVTILKGVTIGEHSIIGANSLVSKDIPANCIAGGVPCKIIKYIDKNQ